MYVPIPEDFKIFGHFFYTVYHLENYLDFTSPSSQSDFRPLCFMLLIIQRVKCKVTLYIHYNKKPGKVKVYIRYTSPLIFHYFWRINE